MTITRIPQEARNRLNQIAQEADEASVLASRTVEQINGLQKSTSVINDADELKAALAEIERLDGVKAQHQQRARELSALATSLGHFLRTLPDGVALELAPPCGVDIMQGEALVDAIGRIRNEIGALQSEAARVKRARLPKSALKKRVAAYVAERAARGAPRISLANGLEIDFAATGFDGGTVRHVIDVLTWLDPQKMRARIEEQIDGMPDDGFSAMTAEERSARLTDLDNQIELLERQEETAIRTAHDAGLTAVARRQHASPQAVLGVRFKKDKAARSRAA